MGADGIGATGTGGPDASDDADGVPAPPAVTVASVPDVRALALAVVHDPRGRHIGRVLDVYLADRTGEVVAASVTTGRLGGRDIVVPVELLASAGHGRVSCRIDRERVRRGMRAPVTAHLRPADLAEARSALQY
ncbi:PRC-barrel domain-containing protein [Brachybacterium huguangmaarense]